MEVPKTGVAFPKMGVELAKVGLEVINSGLEPKNPGLEALNPGLAEYQGGNYGGLGSHKGTGFSGFRSIGLNLLTFSTFWEE